MFRRRSQPPADEPGRGKANGAAGRAAANGAAPGTAGSGRATSGGAAQPGKAASAGKGRPTPKRSQAAPRRQPMTAPGNRKQATRQSRERQRAERARRMEGLKRGDPRYIPAKDRGPVRALARDYVDSRRMLSEYYLYVVGVMFILFVIPSVAAKLLVYPLVLLTVLTVTFEGIITGRQVRKMAAQRYPDESTKGVGFYAALRSAQIRRLRIPAPRVRRGEQI